MAAAAGTVMACHTTDEFDAQLAKAMQAGKMVVIDFMLPGCGGCQEMAPVFAECAKEYPTKAVFLEVDIAELKDVASRYNIKAAPTIVFIMDHLILNFVGVSPDKLRKIIEDTIGAPESASSA